MQANISTLQTNLQTNTSSPNLVQTSSTNELPSSDARVLVQFNSLAPTARTSAIPQDIADLDAVVNSTFFPNVDTHVLELDNSTVNPSDLVTELRGRDGEVTVWPLLVGNQSPLLCTRFLQKADHAMLHLLAHPVIHSPGICG